MARVVAASLSLVSWSVPRSPACRHSNRPPSARGVDLVNIGVTVTDKKGNLVTDLTADDFEVIEDGETQTISYFAAGDRPVRPGPSCISGSCSTSAKAWAKTSASRGPPRSSS